MKLGNDGELGKLPEGSKIHKFDDKIEIVAVKDSKHMQEGKTYKVHRLQADYLIKAGKAKKA